MIDLCRPVAMEVLDSGPVRRRVVELAGLAAAGKSTLLEALAEREPAWRTGIRPARGQHAVSALTLLPTLLTLHLSARRLLWKEAKRITYLRTLGRELAAEARRPDGAVVLDEGAVYMMARMRMYGGPAVRSPAFDRWWSRAYETWSRTLDLVVWLDAPDEVLARRLRERVQRHRLQGAEDRHIEEFLVSYRAAYGEVMTALRSRRVRVLEFRTDQEPTDRIAERITASLRGSGCR